MLVLAASVLSSFPPPSNAQRDDNADGVELRPGLLIHPTLNVAYVMTPEGIAAVNIATGAKQWTSNAAAKPLAVTGNLLISQVEPKTAANELELVALNVQQQGQPTVRGVTELPSGVRVSIGETLKGTFEIDAQPSAGSVFVNWNFKPVRRRGIKDEVSTDAKNEAQSDAKNTRLNQRVSNQSTTEGALRMNIKTGAMTRQRNSTLKVLTLPQRTLTLSEKIANAPPAQFESADGLHILASERVGDDRVWDKYRWTVYERSTGRRVGEFRTHISFAPFVIRNSLALFETTPFRRRGAPPEPAKLRAVSLTTGQEVWGVEVREIAYRGPFPP
jgi:hypothetical protein